jgi:hypothetical protein
VARCRVLLGGVERVGTNVDDSTHSNSWVLTNGLVSVSAASGLGTWNVAAWDGSQWDSKTWSLGLGSSATGQNSPSAFAYTTILRNDYEMCTVRILNDGSSNLDVIDLTLRRGSRFVEGRVISTASQLLAVWPTTAEAGTSPASSGYVRATSNDAQGNRYVVGSARSFAALTASGGLAKASTTSLDFFIGAEVSGSAAVTGDQAANLVAQYLTAMGEVTVAGLR